MSAAEIIWQPDQSARSKTPMARFLAQAAGIADRPLDGFAELHAWSVEHPAEFWPLAWDFCGLVGDRGDVAHVGNDDPMQVQFFPGARLNVAETFLKNADGRVAVVFVGEDGRRIEWTRAGLKREVGKLAAALRAEGIGKGDHVVGYVPNMPQSVAAMLATASLGAIWSSCAPENGPDVVVDRFGQIEPRLMFAADGYFHNGWIFDTRPAIAGVVGRIPSIEKVVMWACAGDCRGLPEGCVAYDDFRAANAPELVCEPMGFRDPLYVMFSSGTTGKPKCIEHSGGGALLRAMTEQQLHSDLRPGDRMFYYTTCSWMMWNWLIAALASEAAIILYDGNPMYPDIGRLFDLADAEAITHFGTSAKYVDASLKRRNRPRDTHRLTDLRVVLSTGSPLSPDGFSHVYADWKSDLQLASICGGTDILGCFIGGCPILPVRRGEIQSASLGLDVATLDDRGRQVTGVAGELVCRNAHPSMPTRFLNDPDNARYRAAYFGAYPNIWRQGDFTIRTEHGGFIVLGRSDATLNPGGVRIGTAEIYRRLDRIDGVLDYVVVGQNFDNDVRVVLFVVLAGGVALDEALVRRIKGDIRTNASPRHVPARIIAVADVPRTKSGKTAELAVRDVVNREPVRNLSGLANPEALELFADLPELQD